MHIAPLACAFALAVSGFAAAPAPMQIPLGQKDVRLATAGVVQGVACEGCPPLPELAKRYTEAGGRLLVCPICFNARHLADDTLVENAALGGTVPLWEWIGDEPATTFSY